MATKIIRVLQCHCEVCGHEWEPKGNEKPLRCAKCKSPYWDRKK